MKEYKSDFPGSFLSVLFLNTFYLNLDNVYCFFINSKEAITVYWMG